MSAAGNSTGFNPRTQTFTLFLADGVTPFNMTVSDLDSFNFYNMQVVTNYSAQLGACVVMLVVVLLITSPSKRKSRLFWINIISLIICITRLLLAIKYWISPWSEAFSFFAYDYSNLSRADYANSIAAIVMNFLLLCCVELSLFLQVQVITRAMMGDQLRWILMGLSGIVITLTVGFRFGQMVHNAKLIVNASYSFDITWLVNASLILETLSIWYFCLIFSGKLGYCMWERKKKLALKPWGPMDVLFIMGGCTMVIPSIFAILEYFPDSTFPEAGSIAITLVTIFLPLSSIWASATPDNSSPIFRSEKSTKSSQRSKLRYGFTMFGAKSETDTERNSSATSPVSPAQIEENAPNEADYEFLSAGSSIGMAGVRIDRTYSVHSGRAVSPGNKE